MEVANRLLSVTDLSLSAHGQLGYTAGGNGGGRPKSLNQNTHRPSPREKRETVKLARVNQTPKKKSFCLL